MASCPNPNKQPTSYQYDNMAQLTHVGFPDAGEAAFTYNVTSAPFNMTTSKKMDSRYVYSKLTVDGLARTVLTQLCEDGTSSCTQPIKADTVYDGLSRTSTASNPNRSTGDSTYAITPTAYNALNPVTNLSPPAHSPPTNPLPPP